MEETNESTEYVCSNCSAKINPDDTKCSSCGAELEWTKDDDIIELRKFDNDVEAEMAKSLLDAEGIESFLKGGPSVLETIYSTKPIILVVLNKDRKRALEILDSV